MLPVLLRQVHLHELQSEVVWFYDDHRVAMFRNLLHISHHRVSEPRRVIALDLRLGAQLSIADDTLQDHRRPSSESRTVTKEMVLTYTSLRAGITHLCTI